MDSLSAHADSDEIIAAVRGAAAGDVTLAPAVAAKIVAEFNRLDRRPPQPQANDPMLETLTERELSVLQQMAQGKTNQEIADTLFLAKGTVKNNVSSILGKLHANDRTQAVLAALRKGIVTLD